MSYLKGIADRVNKMDAKNNFNLLEIDIDSLVPSKNNFYGIREIEELAESIKENGLMHNLVVRKLDNNYEIISGHRRFHAMKILDFKKIPCQVKNISDLDTEILLIQANSQQRELTHLEKMKGIERLTALYKQKKDNGEEVPKGKTRDLIGKDIGLSGVQVGRYTKVSEKLIEPLKTKLDHGNITLTQATTLSGLKKDEQESILNQIEGLDIKDSKQEVDILVEGIKQPVENKKDKEFIKEIYGNEYEDIEHSIIQELLEKYPLPKIIISNDIFEITTFTQEVTLSGGKVFAKASGFSRTNRLVIKVDNPREVSEIKLLDNNIQKVNKALEIAPGAYLWFTQYKGD